MADTAPAERARGRVLLIKRSDYVADPAAAVAAAVGTPVSGADEDEDADLASRLADAIAADDAAPADHVARGTGNGAPAEAALDDSVDGELAALLADAALAPEDEAQLLVALSEMDDPATGAQEDEAADFAGYGELAADAQDADGAADADAGPATPATPDEDGALQEDEISRLVETANSRLKGAESQRRMSAIAHLKAAVAATVADRKFGFRRGGEPEQTDSELDRYRDDLSRVVQPRRASAQGTDRRPEPAPARPAPLMLVSEQRIDAQLTGEAGPARLDGPSVLPRRIGGAAATASTAFDDEDEDDYAPLSAEDAGSFAEFAEAAGATELPDLLEAAAAYIAIHEGRDHFSRPQVMRKVAAVSPDEFTREQGLQSFGKLLRQGRIQKVRRGQFTIAKSSKFTPSDRGAAM